MSTKFELRLAEVAESLKDNTQTMKAQTKMLLGLLTGIVIAAITFALTTLSATGKL